MTGDTQRPTAATPIAYQDPLPDAVDVAVIGAGVIGIFAALYMARRGLRVLVAEKGRIGAEQSSRNWGWIRQQGRDHAELPVMMQALRLWHEVDRETNGACGLRTCGTNYLSTTEESLASNAEFLALADDAGLEARMLGRAEVSALFSDHGDGRWVGGTQVASDACGEPWQAVPAVAGLAYREGVVIREDCAVRALDIQAGRITGIVTEHGAVACSQVVLAAGAWSSLFARRHGISIPQIGVRSTVARTAAMPEFFSGAAADGGLALRRRRDGGYTLATGGTISFYLGPDIVRSAPKYWPHFLKSWAEVRPHPGAPTGHPDAWGTKRRWAEDDVSPFERTRVLEARPRRSEIARMPSLFHERFPGAGTVQIRDSWAGIIDAMPDVVPIVDRVPTLDGLIIATGMSGHGFGIGPGFGDVIARMATGAAQEHDLGRFRFSRFTDGSKLELGPLL